MVLSRHVLRRTLATTPSTEVLAKPLTARLQEQNAKFWMPKKSDPVEGFGLAGLLAGTMFVCIIPGLWAAMTPKAGDH